jgi:hypothetical protein
MNLLINGKSNQTGRSAWPPAQRIDPMATVGEQKRITNPIKERWLIKWPEINREHVVRTWRWVDTVTWVNHQASVLMVARQPSSPTNSTWCQHAAAATGTLLGRGEAGGSDAPILRTSPVYPRHLLFHSSSRKGTHGYGLAAARFLRRLRLFFSPPAGL